MRYRFLDCELDLEKHILVCRGTEVHVEPQVFGLLACLVQAEGRLVSYDALIAQVWGGRIVSDATVAARLSAARAAVGDDGRTQGVIRTVHGRGVQWVAAVTEAGSSAPREPMSETPMTQRVRFATSRDGTGIAWAEMGAGPPLMRGGHWLGHLEHDLTSPVWRPVLARLARGRRLVRYDARGTGLSDRELRGATVEQLADDMEAVADAAGLDRFPIYAASQSVPVALTLAARRPERISRLILLNGVVQGSTARGEAEKTELIVGMIRSGWGVPGSAFMRALATVFMPLSTQEELESLVEMQGLSASADVAAAIRRTIGDIDVLPILEKVVCPVLAVHCDGDQVQSPGQSRLIARTVRDAEFLSCASPNHILVPSDPAWTLCADALDLFLGDAP